MNQVDLLISHNPTETPEQHKPSGCNSVHWYLFTLYSYIKTLCQGEKTDLVDFTNHPNKLKISIGLSGLNNTSVTGAQCTAKKNRSARFRQHLMRGFQGSSSMSVPCCGRNHSWRGPSTREWCHAALSSHVLATHLARHGTWWTREWGKEGKKHRGKEKRRRSSEPLDRTGKLLRLVGQHLK